MFTYIYIYIHIYIYVYSCLCVCVHTGAYHVHMWVCTYVLNCAHICICVRYLMLCVFKHIFSFSVWATRASCNLWLFPPEREGTKWGIVLGGGEPCSEKNERVENFEHPICACTCACVCACVCAYMCVYVWVCDFMCWLGDAKEKESERGTGEENKSHQFRIGICVCVRKSVSVHAYAGTCVHLCWARVHARTNTWNGVHAQHNNIQTHAHAHANTQSLSLTRTHTSVFTAHQCKKKKSHTSTHPHTHYDTRRCIGFFKLQVIFRKRATNCRALLRKITYEDKASYGFAPPCTWESVSGCVFMDIYILLRVYTLVLQQHCCVWTYICILFTSVYMYTYT